MYKAMFVILALLVMMVGCAPSDFDAMQQSLESGTGKLTFSQAKEKWGEPVDIMKSQGKFIAHWTRLTNSGFAQSQLYITFDNQHKLMRAYRYESKPTP